MDFSRTTSGLLTLGVHGLVIGLVLMQRSFGAAPTTDTAALSVFALPAQPQSTPKVEPQPERAERASPAPPPSLALPTMMPAQPLLRQPAPLVQLAAPVHIAAPPQMIASRSAQSSTSMSSAPAADMGDTAPNAAPSPDAGKDDAYARKVLAWIGRHKDYPRSLAREGTEGTVLVRLHLASDGDLEDVALARSSGFAELDRLALDQLRTATPYPRPPRNLPAMARRFLVPMRYRLAG
ncbi:energy transducer TonB [Sphingobium yanoikuyae]|jgi:protein TonB|uniref:Energy transducer TonB n=2 Tax=Sphingobium yanoikuyae TaxID=13690 RepID=A0A3G2UTG1_SPHYA|nr:energy transducer TonB [Sphingobium yanoikuyae]AYO78225.1 energy transducer TonB [Sphingobium yanoikuyae]MDV3480303.1 energy transducer TonB [Sphingobium yanoikuyae]